MWNISWQRSYFIQNRGIYSSQSIRTCSRHSSISSDRDFLGRSQGPKFGPNPNGISNFEEKKSQSSKKNIFVLRLGFSFSPHTHKQSTSIAFYFSFIFYGKSMCNSLYDFLFHQKWHKFVHYIKFPTLGVYHANFPNLKGPFPKSQKKSLSEFVCDLEKFAHPRIDTVINQYSMSESFQD